jgi:hypothetical protein
MEPDILVPLLMAKVVPTEVRSDFEQPRPGIGLLWQSLIGFIGAQKGLLEEVLRLISPMRQPPDIQ